jgi:HD-GYP domain-containing protein (c-di-GMP phosphodiesterase class II)
VRSHHERFDGTGYPGGLSGEEIPLAARIFAIADSFDAMTSDRPYRSALSADEAVAEILAGSGTQFDPACVDAFEELAAEDDGFVLTGPARTPSFASI